jgi:hypothetical protein
MNMKRIGIYILTAITALGAQAQTGTVDVKHEYTYNSIGLKASDRFTESNGDIVTQYFRYPSDVFNTSCSSNILGLKTQIDKNILENPVETYKVVEHNGVTEVVDATRLEFNGATVHPDKLYKIHGKIPFSSFTPFAINASCGITSDSHYELEQIFTYDIYGNVTEVINVNKNVQSYLYSYNGARKIAEVINGNSAEIAYSSFETLDQGNWNYNASGRVLTSATSSPPKGKTGEYYYNLTSGSMTATIPVKKYILTYWYKDGSVSVSNSVSNKTLSPQTNPDGWICKEHIIDFLSGPSTVTITISGDAKIDEIRLHPYTAEMKTYTYHNMGGVSAENDSRNNTRYFEYDEFGRLLLELNPEYSIIKKYEYKIQQAD